MAQVRSNRAVPEVLREASGIFRALSAECLALICQQVQECRFQPGEEIWQAGDPEDRRLCVLASGEAELQAEHLRRPLATGAALGVAGLLGLAEPCGDRGQLRAAGDGCAVLVLHRRDFAAALSEFPEDERTFSRLAQDVPSSAPLSQEPKQLWRTLQRSALFRGSGANFLMILGRRLEAAVFAPGDALFEQGEECLSEESPSFLVLAGRVQVEGEAGALVWTAGPGEVLGASGPLGPLETRATTARAWGKGPVFCVRLPGVALELGFREHPEEREPLEEIVGRLEAAEEEATLNRREWLETVAVPALARTPLLAGCPDEFLRAVAAPLAESSHARGEDIAEVGEASESMLVVLEGSVDLVSRAGARVGTLRKDGVTGEAELLGLMTSRLVSVRAASACRVLEVAGEALARALRGPHGGEMKEGLERLVELRRTQAEQALPLSDLSVGAKPEDPSARTAGLLAELLHFESGQYWEPLPDSDPCGAHVGILARGRAVLTVGTDDKEVGPLPPGSLLLEGLLADFGARVRLVSGDCEVYRLRRAELEAAARLGCGKGRACSVTQEVADWFYQFRLAEKEVRARLHDRLNNARGLAAIKEKHPCDNCIQDWSQRRQRSLRRAEQMRLERADVVGSGKPPLLQLPLLPKPHNGMDSTEFRSWGAVPERRVPPLRKGSGASSCKALPCLPKSLAAYPVMRLPKVHSEPHLRRPRSRERANPLY